MLGPLYARGLLFRWASRHYWDLENTAVAPKQNGCYEEEELMTEWQLRVELGPNIKYWKYQAIFPYRLAFLVFMLPADMKLKLLVSSETSLSPVRWTGSKHLERRKWGPEKKLTGTMTPTYQENSVNILSSINSLTELKNKDSPTFICNKYIWKIFNMYTQSCEVCTYL